MKAALSKVGDKLGVSDKARAPQDDSEFVDLEKALTNTHKNLKDLETRLVLFNSSAQKVLSDGEKLALQCAAVFSPFQVGRNGEFARVKEAKGEHDKRHANSMEMLKGFYAEIKRVQDLVAERHKLGAELQKGLKKAAEGDEERTGVAEAESAFLASHETALAEMRQWKKSFGIELSKLHQCVLELELAFVTKPPTAASSATAAEWFPKLW